MDTKCALNAVDLHILKGGCKRERIDDFLPDLLLRTAIFGHRGGRGLVQLRNLFGSKC
jgi:hypothetical protein